MSGSAVYLGIFGVAATAMDADLLHAIYKNRPLRMASYIDVRLMWLFIGILSVSLVLVSAVQGYFEFHGGMFAWWLLYELEDVKPPRKKKTSKGQCMETIVWNTLGRLPQPLALNSATPVLLTPIPNVAQDYRARCLRESLPATVRDYDANTTEQSA